MRANKSVQGDHRTRKRRISAAGYRVLVCDADPGIDAMAVFESLREKRAREVQSRFDHWIQGNQPKDDWFHGWPNDQRRKDCFTFKWKENRQGHRLYGFLCHPLTKSNAAFQLCVLVKHATKNQYETEDAEMSLVNRLRLHPDVVAAISIAYPDSKG